MLDKKEDGGLKTAVKALRFFVRLAAKHKPYSWRSPCSTA